MNNKKCNVTVLEIQHYKEYTIQIGISKRATPIGLRTATFPVYKNNKGLQAIRVQRTHFPLKAACAMTIHKAQGGTFDGVVYTYSRSNTQQLVYVALSRVTSQEGLFIIADNGKNIFYHGRNRDDSVNDLRIELNRLSTLMYVYKHTIKNGWLK